MSEKAKSDYETRIELLENENETLRQRLNDLENKLTNGADQKKETENLENNGIGISRRGTLAALAGAGVLGYGAAGTAAAVDSPDDLLGAEISGSTAETAALTIKRTNSGRGLWVIGEDNDSRVIQAIAQGDNSTAIEGANQAEDGVGIRGFATSSTGQTQGLVGRVQSPDGIGLRGRVAASEPPSDGWGIALDGTNQQDEGTAVRGTATGDGATVGVLGTVSSPNGTAVHAAGNAKVEENLEVDQDLIVQGDIQTTSGNLEVEGTKHFVQAVETPAGPREVVYTSVEAGRPRTEVSDVAELSDGRAEIDLPEHFGLVTSEDEPLTIQVTPYTDEPVSLQITEQSTEHIVVEDVSDASFDCTFAYTVKGVRKGFEDKEPIRDT